MPAGDQSWWVHVCYILSACIPSLCRTCSVCWLLHTPLTSLHQPAPEVAQAVSCSAVGAVSSLPDSAVAVGQSSQHIAQVGTAPPYGACLRVAGSTAAAMRRQPAGSFPCHGCGQTLVCCTRPQQQLLREAGPRLTTVVKFTLAADPLGHLVTQCCWQQPLAAAS